MQALLGLTLALAGAAPIPVCVRAALPERAATPALMAERKEEARSLSREFARVSRELNEAHGQDLKKWPDAARTSLFDAYDASQKAWVGSIAGFAAPDAPRVLDSVRDVKEALAGGGLAGRSRSLALVGECDAAGLVVEILGRTGAGVVVVGDKFVLFSLRTGPALPSGSLAGVPGDWTSSPKHIAWTHRYKDDEPFLQFEAWDDGTWRDVADWIKEHVERLVADHRATLTGELAGP